MTLKTEVMMLKIQLYITGINYILQYSNIEIIYFKLYSYFTILLFYCIFDQIKAALMSIRDFQPQTVVYLDTY